MHFPPFLASIIFAVGIVGLFFFDRGGKSRVSGALWIPTVWLFITGSRSISQWLGMTTAATDQASMYLEGSPLDRAVFATLELAALIVLINRRRRPGPIVRRNWAIGLFFLYAALSISWSDFPFVTLKHWIKGIGDTMIVLIVLTEANVADAIKRLVTRLGFVLLPLSVLFIKYYPLLGRRLTNGWASEAVGVCGQKNGLGELCDLLGLGLLWRFRSVYNDRADPNRRQRLRALGAVLAIIVWLLSECRSMTSICALSMAGAVMLLSTRPAFLRKPAFIHLATATVVGLAASVLVLPSAGGGALIQFLGKDSTLTGRTDNWPIIISVLNNRLVGAGYESFWMGPRLLKLWDAFPNFPINQAHNGYVEIFINLGWLGVALLGILIATGYRNVISAYRHDSDIGSLRIAFFLAAILTGLTEATFRMMVPMWLVFLLATAAAPWNPNRRKSAALTSTQDRFDTGPQPDGVREVASLGG